VGEVEMGSAWDLGVVTMKVQEGVSWLTIDVPGRMNVVSPEMIEGLNKALAICEADADIRVLVVTGDEKALVAGNDIKRLLDGGVAGAREVCETIMEPQERIANLGKPAIAAISGYALGAGLEIALCCDFRIAADTAKLGFPEIHIGVIPGGGGTQRLPRLIGVSAATRMIMLGEIIGAEEAERLGLVDKVVPAAQLRAEVDALAGELVQRPALALWAAKRALACALNVSVADGLRLEQALFCGLCGTEDQREGMAAFLEKRRPEFQGR
jgi:enoyl-CoA hydratase/carnithine racemase